MRTQLLLGFYRDQNGKSNSGTSYSHNTPHRIPVGHGRKPSPTPQNTWTGGSNMGLLIENQPIKTMCQPSRFSNFLVVSLLWLNPDFKTTASSQERSPIKWPGLTAAWGISSPTVAETEVLRSVNQLLSRVCILGSVVQCNSLTEVQPDCAWKRARKRP